MHSEYLNEMVRQFVFDLVGDDGNYAWPVRHHHHQARDQEAAYQARAGACSTMSAARPSRSGRARRTAARSKATAKTPKNRKKRSPKRSKPPFSQFPDADDLLTVVVLRASSQAGGDHPRRGRNLHPEGEAIRFVRNAWPTTPRPAMRTLTAGAVLRMTQGRQKVPCA